VTKPFSIAFKQKMVEKLTGRAALSARQLARDTGISQETLSRWLRDARSLPLAMDKRQPRKWTIDQKVRILAEAAPLKGDALTRFLEREGVLLAELEQWRLALEEEGRASLATTKRIHKLERELARKEKALAEAAALLVLKKKVEHLYEEDEDSDTDEKNEK
jgi:transposase